jgi:hypothetical protein
MIQEETGSIEVEMNSDEEWRKDGVVYNHADNLVFVKTDGNSIHVVCHKEEQTEPVVRKMTADKCRLTAYEEWDKNDDKKWILTFIVDDEYAKKQEAN